MCSEGSSLYPSASLAEEGYLLHQLRLDGWVSQRCFAQGNLWVDNQWARCSRESDAGA